MFTRTVNLGEKWPNHAVIPDAILGGVFRQADDPGGDFAIFAPFFGFRSKSLAFRPERFWSLWR
jgi:hypothetical protein